MGESPKNCSDILGLQDISDLIAEYDNNDDGNLDFWLFLKYNYDNDYTLEINYSMTADSCICTLLAVDTFQEAFIYINEIDFQNQESKSIYALVRRHIKFWPFTHYFSLLYE